MQKTLIALALSLTAGSAFAFNAPTVAQTEGYEVRTSEVIPQICKVVGISDTGTGIAFADTGFGGTAAAIDVHSNLGGETAFSVAFSNTELYFDGVSGRQTLPEIGEAMSDNYMWVAKTDDHAQAFNAEGAYQPVAVQTGMDRLQRIEFYPELRINKTDVPAGELHAKATVTVSCAAL